MAPFADLLTESSMANYSEGTGVLVLVNESYTYEALRESKFALEGDLWLEAH